MHSTHSIAALCLTLNAVILFHHHHPNLIKTLAIDKINPKTNALIIKGSICLQTKFKMLEREDKRNMACVVLHM